MKTFFLHSMIVLFFSVLLTGAPQEKSSAKPKAPAKETVKESKKIWNKFCPVMGDEVNPKGKTVDYKGKVIGFCCKKCIAKFNADPEKYLKNLSGDGQKYLKN